MTPEKSSKREGGALSWLAIYREPVVLRMFFLGFSSGLPLLLVLGTLSFWMREVGVDLKSIGFMSWVGLCWGMKWLWSPLVDKLRIPLLSSRLGQRRAWLLTAQIGLIVSLALMAFADPAKSLTLTAALALTTAFFGATQDIALDAFRIESGLCRHLSDGVPTGDDLGGGRRSGDCRLFRNAVRDGRRLEISVSCDVREHVGGRRHGAFEP